MATISKTGWHPGKLRYGLLSSDVMTPNGLGVDGRKLTVSFRSTALRILFNNEQRAIGIEYLKDGKCVHAFAKRKVILSAGINSPKLLMLSGIGPSDTLNKAGVPVLYDNPNVGQHLTTHVITPAFSLQIQTTLHCRPTIRLLFIRAAPFCQIQRLGRTRAAVGYK